MDQLGCRIAPTLFLADCNSPQKHKKTHDSMGLFSVGATGFEPATSCPPVKCASQSGPRPEFTGPRDAPSHRRCLFEFLDRLAALIPPPRKHRQRYHGVFAPNHPLRSAVTAMVIGNVGEQRKAADRTDRTDEKPCSHNTSRIAWAQFLARVGEAFPLSCPNCCGDIGLISFITQPGPIRKLLEHVGEPLELP